MTIIISYLRGIEAPAPIFAVRRTQTSLQTPIAPRSRHFGTFVAMQTATMNDRESRRYQMFLRVQTFGQDNHADFTAGSKATTALTALGQVILDLDAAKANQQGGTATAREVLLDGLRLDLQNIARTARAIAQDEPGFADRFRPPEGSGQGEIITATDAFLQELGETGVAAKFIAHELPADFVQNLTADRQAIVVAQTAETIEDNEGVESTAAVGRLIRDGMKEVTVLDAVMHNKYARNPDKLRAWQSASHIARAPHREKNSEPAPTPPPPQPPA